LSAVGGGTVAILSLLYLTLGQSIRAGFALSETATPWIFIVCVTQVVVLLAGAVWLRSALLAAGFALAAYGLTVGAVSVVAGGDTGLGQGAFYGLQPSLVFASGALGFAGVVMVAVMTVMASLVPRFRGRWSGRFLALAAGYLAISVVADPISSGGARASWSDLVLIPLALMLACGLIWREWSLIVAGGTALVLRLVYLGFEHQVLNAQNLGTVFALVSAAFCGAGVLQILPERSATRRVARSWLSWIAVPLGGLAFWAILRAPFVVSVNSIPPDVSAGLSASTALDRFAIVDVYTGVSPVIGWIVVLLTAAIMGVALAAASRIVPMRRFGILTVLFAGAAAVLIGIATFLLPATQQDPDLGSFKYYVDVGVFLVLLPLVAFVALGLVTIALVRAHEVSAIAETGDLEPANFGAYSTPPGTSAHYGQANSPVAQVLLYSGIAIITLALLALPNLIVPGGPSWVLQLLIWGVALVACLIGARALGADVLGGRLRAVLIAVGLLFLWQVLTTGLAQVGLLDRHITTTDNSVPGFPYSYVTIDRTWDYAAPTILVLAITFIGMFRLRAGILAVLATVLGLDLLAEFNTGQAPRGLNYFPANSNSGLALLLCGVALAVAVLLSLTPRLRGTLAGELLGLAAGLQLLLVPAVEVGRNLLVSPQTAPASDVCLLIAGLLALGLITLGAVVRSWGLALGGVIALVICSLSIGGTGTTVGVAALGVLSVFVVVNAWPRVHAVTGFASSHETI
jgi:hypothetical protein